MRVDEGYRDRIAGDVFVIIATLATYAQSEEQITTLTFRDLARRALKILPELPLPKTSEGTHDAA